MSAAWATAIFRPPIVAIGTWLYCAAVAAWLFSHWSGAAATTVIPSWWVLPSQFAGTGLVAMRIARGDLSGPRLAAWSLLLASILTDAVATAGFAYLESVRADRYGTWVDAVYLLDYALMVAMCAAFFVACGGDFRRRRVWLDGLTLAIGLVALVMPFILDPVISAGQHPWPEAVASVAYAVGIVAAATMGGLLLTQITNWRREIPTLLILAGFAVALISDVWVTAGDVRGKQLQTGLPNLSDCVYVALFATAAALPGSRIRADGALPDGEGNVYGFLPVLTVLLAIVIVLGAQAHHSGLNIATTAILVLVGALLLIVRQRAVRDELRRLNQELAVRHADARLTELVRRSADAIAVVDAAGLISYLSPASEAVLGPAPGALLGTRAAALLGVGSEALLEAFVRDLTSRAAPYAELEAKVPGAGGRSRTVQIIGSDQSHNPLIDGVVLTLRDVSAQRDLEREVLEIATRERQRLSGDIHEGLGQQLTGIALLLRGASRADASGTESSRQALPPIIEHVNRAIVSVQALARGLSPLQAVRGSLAYALEQLVAETRARTQLDVVLRNTLRGDPVTAVAADHLHRIAQESIAVAAHRSGCTRIEITLASDGARLTLSIADDGRGPGPVHEADDLGLRMIGYRARMLGGATRDHAQRRRTDRGHDTAERHWCRAGQGPGGALRSRLRDGECAS